MAEEGLNAGSDVWDGFDADAFNLEDPTNKKEQIPQKEKMSL